VLSEFVDEVARRGLRNVQVGQTGCIGICQYEPVVEVFVPNREKVTYVRMTPDKVERIVNEHIVGGNIVSEYTIGSENA
jgi:NADP-reducing hydrogenase subunit HndB